MHWSLWCTTVTMSMLSHWVQGRRFVIRASCIYTTRSIAIDSKTMICSLQRSVLRILAAHEPPRTTFRSMHPERCTQTLTLVSTSALYMLSTRDGSHSWRALLGCPTGQRLGNAKLDQSDNAIYKRGYSRRELQTKLLLCFAVVDLLLCFVLLLWNIRNRILRKPPLRQKCGVYNGHNATSLYRPSRCMHAMHSRLVLIAMIRSA